MNKGLKIYLAVLSTITAIAVVIGVLINIVGCFGGYSFSRRHLADAGEMVNETVAFDEEINAIDLYLDLEDVDYIVGDEFKVEYSLPEKLIPEIKVEDGVLVIRSKDDVSINFGLNHHYEKCHLNIYVPKSAELKSINLDLDMGNFEAKSMSCGSFVANLDMGNINIKNAKFESGDVDLDMGNVDIEGEFDSLVADCDMGDIDVKNSNEDADYDLDCDMGDIKVNGKSHRY